MTNRWRSSPARLRLVAQPLYQPSVARLMNPLLASPCIGLSRRCASMTIACSMSGMAFSCSSRIHSATSDGSGLHRGRPGLALAHWLRRVRLSCPLGPRR